MSWFSTQQKVENFKVAQNNPYEQLAKEYEKLLDRLYHNVYKMDDVPAPAETLLNYYYGWETRYYTLISNWLNEIDRRRKEAEEREKIAVVVREELAKTKKKP